MKIYYYTETEKEKKAVLLGEGEEAIELFSDFDRPCAVLGKIYGDFSGKAICLGNFDGVHKGHRAIFEEAKKYGNWGVLLFDRNIKSNEILTTEYEKLKILEKLGADFVVVAEFSEAFSGKTPEEFADFLKDTLNVSQVLAGYDYRFGYKASGTASDLVELMSSRSIETKIIEEISKDGKAIKSTRIRELIKSGKMKDAGELLGYSYSLSGIVEKGKNNGEKMGFPTANISVAKEKLLPHDGVYYGRVESRDAVINVGKNPTFDAEKRTIEAHIMDYEADLYGSYLTVTFIDKIRNEIKFNTIDELKNQIKKDTDWVKENIYGKENLN